MNLDGQSQLSTFLRIPSIQLKQNRQNFQRSKQSFFFSIKFKKFLLTSFFGMLVVILLYALKVNTVNQYLQSSKKKGVSEKELKSEITFKQQINQTQVSYQDINNKNEQQHQLLYNVTDLTQIYKFNRQGQLYEAVTLMEIKQKQITFQQFGNRILNNEVTVVITTSGDSKYLRSTLNSFFRFNSYPIKKILVIKDGVINKQIERLRNIYNNITWLITNRKIGQLAAIDIAYSFIKTQYYFHLEDDWVFMKPGFIQFSLNIYLTHPNVSNVWLFKLDSLPSKKMHKWRIVNYNQNMYSGYNFNPSIHRLKDYTLWPGGFSNLTFFTTFGLGAGTAELVISMHYIMMGKYTVLANENYIRHIGTTNQGGQKYRIQNFNGTEGTKRLKYFIQTYKNWVTIKNKKQNNFKR